MFILYLDASGVPENSGYPAQYAMVGICVHEGTWFALQNRFLALKNKFAFPGIPFELHAKDFAVSLPEQDEIPDFDRLDRRSRRETVLALRRKKLDELRADATVSPENRNRAMQNRIKKYRQTDSYVHLTRRERSSLLEEGLDLVGSHDGIRLFGEIVEKPWLLEATGKDNAIQHTFAQMVSRFDAFLRRHNQHSPPINNGLLLMDREPTYERYIEQLFAGYRHMGHPWGDLHHVIETPLFIDSRSADAVQAVDLCSYASRRYVGKIERDGSPEEQNFLRIFHKFDRDGARLHGLRHYCKRGSCNCLICRDRGHSSRQDAQAISPLANPL